MKLVTSAQMRRIDEITIGERGIPGAVLMERAGKAVARETMERFEPDSVAVLTGRGNNAGALDALQLAEQLLGNTRVLISLVDLTYGYGRLGRDEDAQRLFTEMESLAGEQDIGAGGRALVYLGIGDEERALEALREGAEKAANKELDPGFFSLMNLKANYANDPRLEQPEFVAVLSRLTGD